MKRQLVLEQWDQFARAVLARDAGVRSGEPDAMENGQCVLQRARAYLFISSHNDVPDIKGIPLVLIAKTNQQDMIEQERMIDHQGWRNSIPPNYYRVIAE